MPTTGCTPPLKGNPSTGGVPEVIKKDLNHLHFKGLYRLETDSSLLRGDPSVFLLAQRVGTRIK